ncbi:hypothetical protein NECAME_11447 [Necator americanus]|nr:hypothetical protein NECAME_11447 [Necator americanus]ETN76783.1 hypothetical protein NECAME_11447 [Necator americanus]
MNSPRNSDENGSDNGGRFQVFMRSPREEHPTSSSTAVNPHIRRQRRRGG